MLIPTNCSRLATRAVLPSWSSSLTTRSGDRYITDVCSSHTALIVGAAYLLTCLPSLVSFLDQTNVNTPDRTILPVTTMPSTNSFTTSTPSTTPSTSGSNPLNPPLHPLVLAILLVVIILLSSITSIIIFRFLRVHRQRLPQQSLGPNSKPPLTPSKIQICQVIEVPEQVINGNMIDIQSPWSPINPRKLETPFRIGPQ